MKKKNLCIILTIMVSGIILAMFLTIKFAKENHKEYLESQKKISMSKVENNISNDSEDEENDNNGVLDSNNQSNGTEVKETLEEVNELQSNDKEVSVDNNDREIEKSMYVNESNNETEKSYSNLNGGLINESNANSNDEIINIEKPKEESDIDYSTNVGAPNGELVMSYDYLRVYLEKDYISVYKNVVGIWEFHAGADIIQNPPYSFKAINNVYMFTDSRIPSDKSYDLTIVTYDHPDRLRTESYIQVMLDGEILYIQNI